MCYDIYAFYLNNCISYVIFNVTTSEFDSDKDGKLSKKEVEEWTLAYEDKQFKEADTNKDGFIDFDGKL
jgi:hypothetical protein